MGIENSDSVQDVGCVYAKSYGNDVQENHENNAVIGVGGSDVIQYVIDDIAYTHGSSFEAPSYYTTRHSTSKRTTGTSLMLERPLKLFSMQL